MQDSWEDDLDEYIEATVHVHERVVFVGKNFKAYDCGKLCTSGGTDCEVHLVKIGINPERDTELWNSVGYSGFYSQVVESQLLLVSDA